MLPFRRRWPVTRVLALIVGGAFLTLMIDVRFEHVGQVRREWTAWIPIYYAGFMAVVCAWALVSWRPLSRRVMFWCCAAGLAVGLGGLWLHNDGQVFQGVWHVLSAWFAKVKHENDPPQIAPLAFCGIGLLGMLASAAYYQPAEAGDEQSRG